MCWTVHEYAWRSNHKTTSADQPWLVGTRNASRPVHELTDRHLDRRKYHIQERLKQGRGRRRPALEAKKKQRSSNATVKHTTDQSIHPSFLPPIPALIKKTKPPKKKFQVAKRNGFCCPRARPSRRLTLSLRRVGACTITTNVENEKQEKKPELCPAPMNKKRSTKQPNGSKNGPASSPPSPASHCRPPRAPLTSFCLHPRHETPRFQIE